MSTGTDKRRNFYPGLAAGLITALSVGCASRALPISYESPLEAAIVTGTGGHRVDGVDIGNIYSVTTVISATSGNPYSLASELRQLAFTQY